MTPGPWTFALLALAAYRLYRLIARDTIAEPLRAALTYPDATAVTLDRDDEGLTVIGLDDEPPRSLRVYASTLLRCHWCLGAWVSGLVWGLWLCWPHATRLACAPLAISAAVALTSRNLDA